MMKKLMLLVSLTAAFIMSGVSPAAAPTIPTTGWYCNPGNCTNYKFLEQGTTGFNNWVYQAGYVPPVTPPPVVTPPPTTPPPATEGGSGGTQSSKSSSASRYVGYFIIAAVTIGFFALICMAEEERDPEGGFYKTFCDGVDTEAPLYPSSGD